MMWAGIQCHIGLTHPELDLLVEQRHHRHRIGHAAKLPDSETVPPRRTVSIAV